MRYTFDMKGKINFSHLMTFALIALLIYMRAPQILQNYKNEGNQIKPFQGQTINGEVVELSKGSGKNIFVFWATWCGPCKLELIRYQKSIKNKLIPSDRIFFINMGESIQSIRQYLQENKYQLLVIPDPSGRIARQFNVEVTPTAVHINNLVIEKIYSGVSPLSIYSAESFLDTI